MTTHYRIVNWDKHYEVNDKNDQWEPGQPFRAGPLKYVRVKCRLDWGQRLHRLHRMAGEDMWRAIGIFEALCQIVGAHPRPQREGGIIRNDDGEPATPEDVLEMLLLEPQTWAGVVRLLSHPRVNWIEEVRTGEEAALSEKAEPQAIPEPPEIPGDSRNLPEAPAGSGKGSEKRVVSGNLAPRDNKNIQGSRTQEPPSRVESRTRQEKQVESSRGDGKPQSLGQLLRQGQGPPYELSPYRLSGVSRGGFDKSSSLVSFGSTRLGFTCLLSDTLRPAVKSDVCALTNLEEWLFERVTSGRASPELAQKILVLARDCVNGDNPMAVFMARVKRELGYTPPSRMEKAL